MGLKPAISLPLAIIGVLIAASGLVIALKSTRIDTRFQTIGLVLCLGVLGVHYIKAEGPRMAALDARRLVEGIEPIGVMMFPIEPIEPEESSAIAKRFRIDPRSVEVSAARIEALMAEVAIMDRVQSNQLVTEEWQAEFQKRLSESVGASITWSFSVRSISNKEVFVQQPDTSVSIEFAIAEGGFDSSLQIGTHIPIELARSLNANDTVKVSGNVSQVVFSENESVIRLDSVSVRK